MILVEVRVGTKTPCQYCENLINVENIGNILLKTSVAPGPTQANNIKQQDIFTSSRFVSMNN